MKLKFGEYEA